MPQQLFGVAELPNGRLANAKPPNKTGYALTGRGHPFPRRKFPTLPSDSPVTPISKSAPRVGNRILDTVALLRFCNVIRVALMRLNRVRQISGYILYSIAHQ